MCGAWLYRFLIFATFLILIQSVIVGTKDILMLETLISFNSGKIKMDKVSKKAKIV